MVGAAAVANEDLLRLVELGMALNCCRGRDREGGRQGCKLKRFERVVVVFVLEKTTGDGLLRRRKG